EKTEAWTPVPPVVATPVGAAPSDAVVLFDGSSLAGWESERGGDAPWKVADGAVTVVPGTGGIRTRRDFCDIQLHIEWRTPAGTAATAASSCRNATNCRCSTATTTPPTPTARRPRSTSRRSRW